VLGKVITWGFALTAFVLVALLRWHLSLVLLGLGAVACAMTYRAIQLREKNQT
jgi:hypothetical protein